MELEIEATKWPQTKLPFYKKSNLRKTYNLVYLEYKKRTLAITCKNSRHLKDKVECLKQPVVASSNNVPANELKVIQQPANTLFSKTHQEVTRTRPVRSRTFICDNGLNELSKKILGNVKNQPEETSISAESRDDNLCLKFQPEVQCSHLPYSKIVGYLSYLAQCYNALVKAEMRINSSQKESDEMIEMNKNDKNKSVCRQNSNPSIASIKNDDQNCEDVKINLMSVDANTHARKCIYNKQINTFSEPESRLTNDYLNVSLVAFLWRMTSNLESECIMYPCIQKKPYPSDMTMIQALASAGTKGIKNLSDWQYSMGSLSQFTAQMFGNSLTDEVSEVHEEPVLCVIEIPAKSAIFDLPPDLIYLICRNVWAGMYNMQKGDNNCTAMC